MTKAACEAAIASPGYVYNQLHANVTVKINNDPNNPYGCYYDKIKSEYSWGLAGIKDGGDLSRMYKFNTLCITGTVGQ